MKEIQNIKKYQQNKKKGGTKCVEILGDTKKVHGFAEVWIKLQEDMNLVEAALLLDYCRTASFSDKDLSQYRLGLEAMNLFFASCYLESENRNKKAQ
jgi:hypothetical protein